MVATPRNRAISVQYQRNFTDYVQEAHCYQTDLIFKTGEMAKLMSFNSLNTTQPSSLTDLSDISLTQVQLAYIFK